MHSDPTSLRDRQKERRRSRIYAAAIELFRERGFQGTTANDIAQASHVSRGTFFNYYPYKEAVLLDYGAEVLQGIHDWAREQLAAGSAPRGVLFEVWARLARESERERDLLLPLAYEILNPDPERARSAGEAMPLATVIEDILERMGARGELQAGVKVRRTAHLVADTYLMTALRWSAYTPEKSLEEEMRVSLEMLLQGALRPS